MERKANTTFEDEDFGRINVAETTLRYPNKCKSCVYYDSDQKDCLGDIDITGDCLQAFRAQERNEVIFIHE